MPSGNTRDARERERREKLAQARAVAERSERRTRILWRSAVGIVVIGLIATAMGLVVRNRATNTSGNSTAAAITSSDAGSVAAGGDDRLPPWPNAADPAAATRAAGITPAREEGAAEHYHAHLDILVNGNPVPVASGIGVDEKAQLMSPLHVHENDGVIHIESPTVGTTFTLGQVFREWDVALTATQIGGLRTDATHTLTAYVNGTKVEGNPATIRLAAHQEIALVYGAPNTPTSIPSTYSFGADL